MNNKKEINNSWKDNSDPIEDIKRVVNKFHPKESNAFLDKYMRNFFKNFLNKNNRENENEKN